MLTAIWAIAATLAVSTAQGRIALEYSVFPLPRLCGGADLTPTVADATVPEGVQVRVTYAARFGGRSRLIAFGTFQGRTAVVVDTDGKADLSRAALYAEADVGAPKFSYGWGFRCSLV